MRRQEDDSGWLPASAHYKSTKEVLDRIENKLASDKEISKEKKENFLRVIKEMNYTMGKLDDRWPLEVDKIIDNLKSILMQFEKELIEINKGSSFFCGSGGNPKQLENTFKRLAGYEHIFTVIRPFQDRHIYDDIVACYEQERLKSEEVKKVASVSTTDTSPKNKESKASVSPKTVVNDQNCLNCELMLAVSLCPNGYIAKKLIKQLPDTEWIAGILHEQGKIVDKDIQKAIEYYKIAYKKKNYEALYRLGSLNERGLYGKPYDYIQMWEEASASGHLEALTDMGYLYENGLQDEQSTRILIQPNPDKALDYYKRAAAQNFPRALNNLATFYFSSQKYRDEQKCVSFLQLAAEAEYVKSLHNLGLIYNAGKLVPLNAAKGKNLIRRAAQKGDIEGRIMYIELMLQDAAHCTLDQLAELNCYCRQIIAKDEQNHEAYYFLGVMYEQGYGVQKQPKTAFLYYTLAAGMQNEAAQLKLGECYKTGFGTEQDMREAIRWYELAAKTNKIALICLGQIYEKGGQDMNPNYQRAFDLYYEACNFGFPEAYIHLGNMYKFGRHVKKNEVKADQYFQKAGVLDQNGVQKKLGSSSSELIQSSYYRRR